MSREAAELFERLERVLNRPDERPEISADLRLEIQLYLRQVARQQTEPDRGDLDLLFLYVSTLGDPDHAD